MSRVLCLLLCASSIAFTQTSNHTPSNGSTPSSATQFVYVIDGTTLTAYNVDPTTFQATDLGNITISQAVQPELTTSPNGRFLYYIAFQGSSGASGNEIFVYDTNASGLPGATPVQKVNATHLYWEAIAHPSGRFLYSLTVGTGGNGMTPYAMVRNLVDQNNGKLSRSVVEATYQLDSNTSFCNPWILGFDASGSIMYDGIYCSYPHGTSAVTYNERAVDLQTGALGPDQQIYTWNYYAGSGFEYVQFVNNLMFDFGVTEFDGDWVNIYQVQPNVSAPLVNCTSSVWAICGNYQSGMAHPSGKYVFLWDSTSVDYIGQVNFSTKQITQTSSIPYQAEQFSPNGTIAYAPNYGSSALDIEIYGFDISSGQVTQGGTITGPSGLDTWLAAERY
jgi:hypothetical protein